ncbi:hypothetical protein B5G27_15605 [Lachnoclostridium sp. An76]|nr:hypothetical protein B5G27_15605 [Lachnoclostridium sp. An76]
MTDEAGRTTRYVYLPGGHLKEIRHPDGTGESFTYDGNVTSMTDGLGNRIRYEYSLSGQLTKVIDALGNETEYSYDVCDRLVEIRQYGEEGSLESREAGTSPTDAAGIDEEWKEAERRSGRNRTCQVTRYLRDLKGQVTEVIDALGQREQYAYDGKGQLLSKLDKEGFLTKYAYTKQGDLSRIQYADGREVKLSYNPLRQLILVQDWLGETKITPDAWGRAKAVQYPDGREVSYTYGKSGERRSITYPDGRTVSYGYDEQVRLSEMREGDRVITYGYDAFGRLSEKKFPNGTESAYTYDSKGQLTELVHRDREGVSDRYTYLYDLTGNKTGITKERRGLEAESGAYAYGYDALGRLSQIQKDGKLQTRYGYDAFGNRVLKEDRAGRTTYCHNALNQLITEIREEGSAEMVLRKAYQYDKRGNLTRITENGQMTQQYVYGALNRLEEAVNGAGKAAKYQYNGLGHRVGKAEGRLPADQTGKLDPQSRIDREIGNLTQIHYTIDLTREYHNLLEKTEGEKRQTYFWDGNVASYEENGRQRYYLQDELGSPLRIADESGTIRESYGYGVFGEDLYGNQGEMQPFGYTGYQRDKVAGNYYAQAREYQADVGRFAGRDIIKGQASYPLTINEYIYCGNMPFYFYDPNGLFWHIVAGAVVGAVANTVINVGTSLLKGEKITWSSVISSVIGGAVTGGVTAATGNVTLGSVAGGAAETITKGAIDGDSIQNIVQDVAVGAVADVAFSKAGKFLKNTSKVKQVTDFAKGTKLGNKIFTHNADYKSEIKRLRGIWEKTGKAVKPKFKTYVDGFVGMTGMELIDKVADMNGSLTPGMDLKKELKNILNSLYDKGEEWAEENRKMQQYTQQALTQILKNLTNEEVAAVMCIE